MALKRLVCASCDLEAMVSSSIYMTDSLICLNVTDMGPYRMSTFTTASTTLASGTDKMASEEEKKQMSPQSVLSSHGVYSFLTDFTLTE